MSVLYHTSEKAELKRPGNGFILALFGMALALVIASAIFTPVVGGGITDVTWLVGP